MGLDTVELVMEFENAFDLHIPNRDAEKLCTVGDVTDYITARLAAEGRPRERALVSNVVRKITCEQGGTTLDRLTDETRFVDDLGMD